MTTSPATSGGTGAPANAKKKSIVDKWMQVAGLPAALIVFVFLLTMPTPDGLLLQGKAAIAVFFSIFILWVTQSLPTYLSSLVAIVLLVITGAWSEKQALGVFGLDVMWVMLMAFFITSGMEKSGFAKRLALWIVSKFGHTAKSTLATLAITNLILAFLVPSTTARATLMLPISLLILKVYKAVPGESNFGRQLAIQQLQFNNISTTGILTATSPQIMAVGLIKDLTGASITWMDWFAASFPIAALSVFASLLIGNVLFKSEVITPPLEDGQTPLDAKKEFKEQYKALGKLSKNEIKALIIFALTVFLWATDGHHYAMFGLQISLVLVTLISGILFFMPYIGIANWKDAKVPWDLVLFSVGAYSVGLALDASGGASFLLNSLFGSLNLASLGFFKLYAVVIFVAMFSHLVFTSKTVRTIILIPTIIGIAKAAGVNPVALALPASFTISDVITLPPSSKPNLIFYSTGYFSVLNQFVYGILVLLVKWILLVIASLTWFKFLGIY
ncbi:MAG: anion transporter [Veillonellaceae bacterium]|nr:anion transporter [Veillonellaceae bacterium]